MVRTGVNSTNKLLQQLENPQINNSHLICVTGRMASGKNYVCSLLESNGWISRDADLDVHEAIKIALPEIFNTFEPIAKEKGINIKNGDGSLNRRALGKILFEDPFLLKRQEDIVYPVVTKLTKDFIASNPDKKIILNATVLFKIPEILNMCDLVLFVDAPYLVRLQRSRKRDKLPYKQIISRFKSQKNLLQEYEKAGVKVLRILNR